MDFLTVLLKILFILAAVFLMALPILLEYFTFHRDKENKISYKRFRMVVFTGIYVIAITVVLCLLRDNLSGLTGNQIFTIIMNLLSGVASRYLYLAQVIIAVVINIAIGLAFWLLSKLVRIGLKKKDLTKGKKKNGDFTLFQKWERGVVKFFYTETWFYVGNILKWLNIVLSVAVLAILITAPLGAIGMDLSYKKLLK